MKTIVSSNALKKDYKRIKKRALSLEKLAYILELLINDQQLPTHARPHKLIGEHTGFWECHIEPNWLLIYSVTEDEVHLYRTGTHVDLFKNY